MTRFNANIIAMLRARFALSEAIDHATNDTLLRAYALFRSAVPMTDHTAWNEFPAYVQMSPAQRTKQWAAIFNRKD